jgi:hypothetical protein
MRTGPAEPAPNSFAAVHAPFARICAVFGFVPYPVWVARLRCQAGFQLRRGLAADVELVREGARIILPGSAWCSGLFGIDATLWRATSCGRARPVQPWHLPRRAGFGEGIDEALSFLLRASPRDRGNRCTGRNGGGAAVDSERAAWCCVAGRAEPAEIGWLGEMVGARVRVPTRATEQRSRI